MRSELIIIDFLIPTQCVMFVPQPLGIHISSLFGMNGSIFHFTISARDARILAHIPVSPSYGLELVYSSFHY